MGGGVEEGLREAKENDWTMWGCYQKERIVGEEVYD